MTKLKALDWASFLGKVGVVAILYYTVFANSILAGLGIILCHVSYEVCEKLYLMEAEKEVMNKLEEALREKTFGGTC